MSVPSKVEVRRYTVSIALIAIMYSALVFFVMKSWLPSVQEGFWKYIVALTPVLPVLWGWPVFTRFIRAMDEMYQKIVGNALQTTFGVTALATFAYGWLEIAGLAPVSVIMVFPFMFAVFGFALGAGVWRTTR